jgi:hypothetical protein
MVTCNRFVYAGNINKDEEKFWFLNFVGFYLRLHKDGYYFDCSSDSWQHDVFSNLGKSSYDIKNRIQQCTDKDIDTAMNYLSVYLQRMKSDSEHYYRFVDYDNHVFGTHSKLYSWVHIPLKKFSCTDDSNAKITKEISVFPEDVKWKNRAVTDIENEMKIFY